MKLTQTELADIRKALVAVAGLAAQAINAGLVSGTLAHWIALALAALTAVGVYAVPNGAAESGTVTPAPAPAPAPSVVPGTTAVPEPIVPTTPPATPEAPTNG